jgi:predicted NBD/HSP70 family sugar kinase
MSGGVASQVAAIIRKAVKTGLITERGTKPSNGGRPRVLFHPNPEFAELIGVDIGRGRIRFMVTDFAGERLAYKTHLTETAKGKDHLLNFVNKELDSIRTEFPRVAAIGLSISGVIDSRGGVVISWPMIEGWSETPLREILESAHGLPVFVEDSVRAMALAEQRLGEAKGLRNFIFLSIGMGIGSAVFVDGRLVIGRDGLAGELGHTTVDEAGPVCSCGSRGCLEVYSSATAIVSRVRRELGLGVVSCLATEFENRTDQLWIEAIAKAADQHDRLSERVLSEAGTHLGTAIATVVNLLNPEKVILAGTVSQSAGQVLLGPLLYNLRQRALARAVADLPVVISSLGEDAAPIGMILRAREEVLQASIHKMCNTHRPASPRRI